MTVDRIEALERAVERVQKDLSRATMEIRGLRQLVQEYFSEQDRLHERIARELKDILDKESQ